MRHRVGIGRVVDGVEHRPVGPADGVEVGRLEREPLLEVGPVREPEVELTRVALPALVLDGEPDEPLLEGAHRGVEGVGVLDAEEGAQLLPGSTGGTGLGHRQHEGDAEGRDHHVAVRVRRELGQEVATEVRDRRAGGGWVDRPGGLLPDVAEQLHVHHA